MLCQIRSSSYSSSFALMPTAAVIAQEPQIVVTALEVPARQAFTPKIHPKMYIDYESLMENEPLSRSYIGNYLELQYKWPLVLLPQSFFTSSHFEVVKDVAGGGSVKI